MQKPCLKKSKESFAADSITIFDNIEARDLFLYLKNEKILILADVHIGFEEYLNNLGILVPRFQVKELEKRFEKAVKGIEIKKIIINGDLKHEFGTISKQEWIDTLRFLDFLKNFCREIILLKGNHDTILGPIARKKGLSILNHYFVNDVYIVHGHEIPNDKNFKDAKIVIIGHEHPAISFKQRKDERFKCYLVGKFKRKTLIVQPSCNLVLEGTDVTKECLISPFLESLDLKNFEILVVEDKVYRFGKLKNII